VDWPREDDPNDLADEDTPEPDVDDDFPMSLEYDGLYGVSDFAADQAAREEEQFERELLGE
jgi:hypothetical protein